MNYHLIYTPFVGVGLHGGMRGQKWLAHRIEIFKSYTLKSLLNQTSRDFLHWMSFRPQERNNPLIQGLRFYLESINYKFIFTFDGLMYWDDKFTKYNLKAILRNFLMMAWDCYIYKELKNPLTLFRMSWENKNKTLLRRLSFSLSELSNSIGEEFEWVYLTRIDSDDMFHKDAVELIQKQEPKERKALTFDQGYILNIQTGQLAEWKPPTNSPFHTIIFPSETFFNPQRHLEYYGSFKSHEDIPKVFNCEMLDMNKYCVSFHGKHISTAWSYPLPKKLYHLAKYGTMEPFKGYMYTVSGRNISTHWQSRARKVKNPMIGKDLSDKSDILRDFGI